MSERKYPRRFVRLIDFSTNLRAGAQARLDTPDGDVFVKEKGGEWVNSLVGESHIDDALGNGFWREVFDHSDPAEEKIVNPNCTDIEQLRTQLADARRIISELQAAHGIAVHELGRQRELAAARKATIKHLNKLLKAAGVRV